MPTQNIVHVTCIEPLFSYTVGQQMTFPTVHTCYNLGKAKYMYSVHCTCHIHFKSGLMILVVIRSLRWMLAQNCSIIIAVDVLWVRQAQSVLLLYCLWYPTSLLHIFFLQEGKWVNMCWQMADLLWLANFYFSTIIFVLVGNFQPAKLHISSGKLQFHSE